MEIKLSLCGSNCHFHPKKQILTISLRQSGFLVRVENGGEKRRSRGDTLMVFAQRDDMEVLDEPLYPNFLRVTGAERPYREELLSKMESDGNKVVQDIISVPGKKKYRFCKHMASQRLPGLTDELMKKGKHCILIRNPLDVLATLRGLCDDLGIPFQAAMLKWEPGPRPFDGMWAPYCYKTTHKSTGFDPPRKYPSPFPSSLYNLLEQSLPFYNLLIRYVRRTTTESLPPNLPVPANEKLLAWVGDQIVPRESAKVSVFDSIVQGGDGVWEALRVYNGKVFKMEEHLDSCKNLE